MIEGLELSILGPAFLTGLVVLATHVPLGQEVLRRGIIFIDIAIAQLAGTGMIAWQVLGSAHAWWQLQAAGLLAALCGAVFLTWTERRWPKLQEAIIGVLFVSMASLTILLLAGNPHGGEELHSLLAGQILWVTMERLTTGAVIMAGVLLAWVLLPGLWRVRLFYVVFTLAVTTSVQLVGIYLVFASLVLPALAGYRHGGKMQVLVGCVAGVAGYAAGLFVAAVFDLPAGSTVVLALAAACVLTLLFWPPRART